jgi:hypothetical protein
MAFITPIDQGLYDLLSAPAATVIVNGVSNTVQVTVEPPEEQIEKAVYPLPSIGIQFVGMQQDTDREYDKVWQYSDLTPTTMNKRAAPQKWNFRYQILTHCFYAEHDRLLAKLIMTCIPPKGGYLKITEEGYTKAPVTNPVTPPVQYNLHIYMEEGVRNLDVMGEYREFKKAYTFVVLGWLDEAVATAYNLAYSGVTLDIDTIDETGYHI